MTPTKREERMRGYWDREIDHWARTSYEKEAVSGLVPRFMAHLRSSVNARAQVASGLLRPHIQGKTLLDLGCGDGSFAIGLLQAGAARVTGWDIAPAAIEIANNRARALGLEDRADFRVAHVEDGKFPRADFTTGLGLLDWMPPREIRKMLRRLKGRTVMFSYSEQDNSFAEIVHRIWLCKRLEYFGNGVRAYHHPRPVILKWFGEAGFNDMEVVARKEARFGRLIHNLPKR